MPVTPNDNSVEVPLRTTSSGFLSGEVGLDGFQKSVNFIIDTAASITVISEKLSQEEQLLDLLQPSKMRVFGAAGVTEQTAVTTKQHTPRPGLHCPGAPGRTLPRTRQTPRRAC